MHVRVRCGNQPESIVVVESRLTTIDKFRKLVKEKFEIKPNQQRLFYGGKLLENGYTFHDYNIKLNDVIQLMVKVEAKPETVEDKPKDIKRKKSESKDSDYVDALSNLYAIGDLVDMKDVDNGAWFEGRITRIVKDPSDVPNRNSVDVSLSGEISQDQTINGTLNEETTPVDTNNEETTQTETKNGTVNGEDSQTKTKNGTVNGEESQIEIKTKEHNCEKSSSTNNVITPKKIKNRFKSGKNNCETISKDKSETISSQKTQNRKRGITDYFNKAPKNVKEKEEEIINVKPKDCEVKDETIDAGLLYKVKLLDEEDCENAGYYCSSKIIRPRARQEIKVEDLIVGETVMINHNVDEPHEKGFWYDFKISSINKLRKNYELVGTIYLGAESIPQDDTKIKLHDKVYRIETLVPFKLRSEEQKKMMTTPTEKRAIPLKCTKCRDDFDQPCRECGCYRCSGKEKPEEIILCDECEHGYHMYCLTPPLESLPDEDWYCPDCKRDPAEVIAPGAGKQKAKSKPEKGKRDWGRGMACVGGYEDDYDNGYEFTYTGAGGRDLSGNKRTAEQSCDQTFTRENKALARNCNVKISEGGGDAGDDWRPGKPVRVVRSYKMLKHFPKYAPKEGIRYDGIYKVVKYYPEKGKAGFIVWKYLLRRDDPSPAPWEKNAKQFPVVYPEGYLEAEAEKKALKDKSSNKTNKKRVLKERDPTDNEDNKSPPVKKRRTRASEDKIISPKTLKNNSKTPQKSPISVNPFTLSVKKKNAEKSEPLDEFLTNEELESIKADNSNKKLWDEGILVGKIHGKRVFIQEVTKLFLCIICQDIVANPVTTKCQHNFCMSCLKLAFKSTGSEKCSHCRQSLSREELKVNENLKKALTTLMPGYDHGKKLT